MLIKRKILPLVLLFDMVFLIWVATHMTCGIASKLLAMLGISVVVVHTVWSTQCWHSAQSLWRWAWPWLFDPLRLICSENAPFFSASLLEMAAASACAPNVCTALTSKS